MNRMKLLVAAATGAVALVVLAVPASAHVSIDPSTAEQGSFAKLAINVPNETEDLNTVKVDVQLPQDHPLGSVAVKPKAGWTYVATKTKLAQPITTDDGQITEAVSEIVWTATGDGIKPGEFEQFEISAGPMPADTDTLVFKTIQTYSDGSEVAWIELPDASGAEPEHPAPTLTLVAATGTDDHSHSTESSPSGSSESSSSAAPGTTEVASAAHDDSGSDDSKGLAIAALVVAVIGVAVGGVALARSRKGPSTP